MPFAFVEPLRVGLIGQERRGHATEGGDLGDEGDVGKCKDKPVYGLLQLARSVTNGNAARVRVSHHDHPICASPDDLGDIGPNVSERDAGRQFVADLGNKGTR